MVEDGEHKIQNILLNVFGYYARSLWFTQFLRTLSDVDGEYIVKIILGYPDVCIGAG